MKFFIVQFSTFLRPSALDSSILRAAISFLLPTTSKVHSTTTSPYEQTDETRELIAESSQKREHNILHRK
jgi:hypothetical protein